VTDIIILSVKVYLNRFWFDSFTIHQDSLDTYSHVFNL